MHTIESINACPRRNKGSSREWQKKEQRYAMEEISELFGNSKTIESAHRTH